ncbi:cobalt transporter CbiM [Halarcobacter anaerophilus]|uniref:Cobalamin biosynthesis protein n=1 Tax=Halarcobacter anaerophilus TaxID=877500 RepID=A0A4Q0XZ26_9BACT|nr:cobalt transporter CbiM [Halarcobacter anaerophilus]QDF29910.1 cobalt/nickel ECF transporter CbiMNQO, S component CbiM [Halarcobacter anaerophilus]RXJ62872.1 cobalamin biosynthesis protein [Halarcobacter anaerophilus]
MHISDGILSSEVAITTAVITAGLVIYSLKNLKSKNIALVSAMSAVFFIASFIHIPLGPTQIHLILIGIIGILIGPCVFLSILIALLFQAVLLGYGGITSLGANVIIMSLPAYITYLVVKKGWFDRLSEKIKYFAIGFFPVLLSTFLLALILSLSKKEYLYASVTIFLANVPAMFIEGVITLFLINYLKKSSPELLKEVNL